MSVATYSNRAKLDPREVEKLSSYAMGEMERFRLLYVGPTGNTVFVGTSRGKLLDLVKDALRVFGPLRARRTIDEHIQNLIQVERERHKRNARPLPATSARGAQ